MIGQTAMHAIRQMSEITSSWVQGAGATGNTLRRCGRVILMLLLGPDGAERTVPGERSVGSEVLGGALARPCRPSSAGR